MLLSTESRSLTIILSLISWLPSLYRGRLGTTLPLPRDLCVHDLNPTAMYFLTHKMTVDIFPYEGMLLASSIRGRPSYFCVDSVQVTSNQNLCDLMRLILSLRSKINLV